jgi:hypothetical protein
MRRTDRRQRIRLKRARDDAVRDAVLPLPLEPIITSFSVREDARGIGYFQRARPIDGT